MQPHLVHLICGATGAGKSTYAMQLTQRLEGVRFSIDEWMHALFWPDSPQPIEPGWVMERLERCHRQIWATAVQAAGRGVPCVLDLGFTQASSRAAFVALARTAGLGVQLHFVDVPAEERWRRVEQRNGEFGGTRHLAFEITRPMFDFVEAMWEPPSEAEIAATDGIRVG